VNDVDSADSGVRQRSPGLRVACAMLSGVTLAALPVFAVVGYYRSGPPGVWAAVVAAAVCWCGATCGPGADQCAPRSGANGGARAAGDGTPDGVAVSGRVRC